MQQWLDSQGHLPKWFRDFHTQKDVFKWIWRAVVKNPGAEEKLAGLDWIKAHVFVIDYFLWFMAKHGYTLQPVKKKDFEFFNWDDAIAQMKDEEAEAFRKMLEERAPKSV